MPKIEKFSRSIKNSEIKKYLSDLDLYGFTKINNFLTKKSVKFFLKNINYFYNKINKNKKFVYKGTPKRNIKDKIVYSLFKKNKSYIDLISDESIIKICMKKLNDPYYNFLPKNVPNYTLKYYNARSSGNKLDLHIDSNIPFPGERTFMMQLAFVLEKSNKKNGCTVVVPGSHRSGQYTDRSYKDLYEINANPGDLVMWDSRLWHGTHENYSNKSRWSIIATMGMWWVMPAMDIVRSIDNSIYKKCTKKQKQLLGFCSIPPINEFERNNTKCGYDFLKNNVYDYKINN